MIDRIKGSMNEGAHWEIIETKEVPPKELVTAVFCVAITENDEIVLARSARGWGTLGGHIEEKDESLEDALKRESIEEGGFTPASSQLFAAMQISPDAPVLRPNSTDQYYPFPISYQLYYWAMTNEPLVKPTGEEIIESGTFSLAAIRQLAIPDQAIIELGYRAYVSSKT